MKGFHIILLLILMSFSHGLSAQANVQELGNLPTTVSETSGLLFHNGRLITHNDSGNTPQLFEIDTLTLEITRTITLTNAENVDWEDLAQDNEAIYVGDFGNNVGTRENLVIYRITKEMYEAANTVQAERINFRYPDQVDFSNTGNSDWDAEAFIVLDDRLVVFTKQWESNGTVAYSIPKTPGVHIAERLAEFDSNGLVTGATYNPISDVLFLIGYSSILGPFTLRIDAPNIGSIFGTAPTKIPFGGGLAQIEGITYVDVDTYFVSSEFFTNASPAITLDSKLFSFTTTDTPNGSEEEEEEEEEEEILNPEPQENSLVLYRPLDSDFLEYELVTDRALYGRGLFDSGGKRLQYIRAAEIENNRIDIASLSSSVYYLAFYLDNGVLVKAFAK